jgi:hypothetical protein
MWSLNELCQSYVVVGNFVDYGCIVNDWKFY